MDFYLEDGLIGVTNHGPPGLVQLIKAVDTWHNSTHHCWESGIDKSSDYLGNGPGPGFDVSPSYKLAQYPQGQASRMDGVGWYWLHYDESRLDTTGPSHLNHN
uniref:Uncharacterized protein n=1 Tax=Populus trichocarpa TaxID=3694 RepID=B9HRQ5_POPTR